MDPERWGEILSTYGRTMRLAVALTDIDGNVLGPCHNPQPVWSLARTGTAESSLEESRPAAHFVCSRIRPAMPWLMRWRQARWYTHAIRLA